MKKNFNKLRSKIAKFNAKEVQSLPSNSVPIAPQDPSSIGLKTIYDSFDATIDIIAIHGQNGHPIESWTNRDNGVLWLRDLLPGVLETNPGVKVRVLSYGYARSDPVESIGARLVDSINELRNQTNSEGRKIIWCAHSFGGPLLRAAMTILPASSDIQVSTHAILFFGVAKNMGLENLDMMLALPETSLSKEMGGLRKEMLWLKMGSEGFDSLNEQMGWRIVWFREVASKGEKVKILDRVDGGEENKGDGYCEREMVVRLGKTHSAMVGFGDAEDEDFKAVVEKVREMVEGALI
ncbi:8ad7835d-6f7e-4b73-9b34-45a7e0e1eebb [Sclerotinia trifoliorum]|uniref:8ad7835d-6f7e-4b73-9b34-45a7e0e1eebb n=1 Tax=Sclerotinia trifoliorum TaxID=28548 RepID=A0A8H2VUI6_9HELO|nr:8ad7835d-6f7e-4b73-9b34-45a7e0e1eebb [Sclerotinia trifoliorum]